MDINQLKEELQVKILQYDVLVESGASQKEILRVYKQIKEIKYQIIMAEISGGSEELVR